MDDVMNHIHMRFHPLMELDEQYIDKDSILNRNNIKVLTYNIFLRPPPVKNNENDWKDERLVDFIKQIENFDILCFQELFGTLTSRRQEFIKYANKSGLFFSVEIPAPSFFSKSIIDAGLLIVSRFPILESEFRPFKYTVLNCSIVEKGIMYVKIKVRDSHIVIFNVHLQSTYMDVNEDQWDFCEKTRLSHVDEIKDFIKETIKERKLTNEDTILLVGDFNIDANNLSFKLEQLEKIGKKFQYKVQDEYGYLIKNFNQQFIARDLWTKNFSKHPFTYGVTGDENYPQYDQVLTDKEDIGCPQTLDYIFEIFIDKNDEDENKINKKIQIEYNSMKIEEFLIEYKPYQQLSDHFGISIELSYKDNPSDSMR